MTSRWEYLTSLSNWHFDESRPPEPGDDSYTFVCNFNGDFTDGIRIGKERANPLTWSTLLGGKPNPNPLPGEKSAAEFEADDLIKANANPNQELFARGGVGDIEVFVNIVNYLGLEDCATKFHNQTTGQMIHTHIDHFVDRNGPEYQRFAIMLDDWHMGQFWQLGNASFTNWKAGDCITWDWKNMPHGTANIGWEDRPMLQLTGKVTDKTHEVLKGASREKVVYV